MARLWESDTSQRVSTRVCLAVLTALLIYSLALSHLKSRSTREVLASTEHPVEYIDPASIDLTLLVNTLINSTQKGNQHLFSLLSVTSHSLLALHKLTLLVYNMSNFQEMESSVFPMRYCYCVTNKTNDLTDFTAILLDVMGNSTTHLQELFKSSSILSVNQRNSSDCIYICVMAGKTDRDLSQMWNVDSITPLFNQTIMEYSHRDNTSHLKLLVDWPHLASDMGLFQVQPSEGSREQSDTTASTAPPTTVTTTTIRSSLTDQTAGCPWKAELSFNSVSREDLRHSRPTLSPLKLQPCVFELCKFFSLCVCRGYSYKSTLQRYCVDSHGWYVRHTSEVCSRVRRLAFSKNLKQQCLARMCVKLRREMTTA